MRFSNFAIDLFDFYIFLITFWFLKQFPNFIDFSDFFDFQSIFKIVNCKNIIDLILISLWFLIISFGWFLIVIYPSLIVVTIFSLLRRKVTEKYVYEGWRALLKRLSTRQCVALFSRWIIICFLGVFNRNYNHGRVDQNGPPHGLVKPFDNERIITIVQTSIRAFVCS